MFRRSDYPIYDIQIKNFIPNNRANQDRKPKLDGPIREQNSRIGACGIFDQVRSLFFGSLQISRIAHVFLF